MKKLTIVMLTAILALGSVNTSWAAEVNTDQENDRYAEEEQNVDEEQQETILPEQEEEEIETVEDESILPDAEVGDSVQTAYPETETFAIENEELQTETMDLLETEKYDEIEEQYVREDRLNGSSMGSASPISLGAWYNGSITSTVTAGWYKFTITSAGRITVTAQTGIRSVECMIIDASGNWIWTGFTLWNDTTEQGSMKVNIDLTKGTYYFVADESTYGYTGKYSFKLDFTSANESFAEPNNSLGSAAKASLNTSYNGQIAENDEKDFYRIILPSSGRITLTAKTQMKGLEYMIYDASGNWIWTGFTHWNDTTEQGSTTEYIDLTKGTYYFAAEDSLNYTGNYSFKLAFSSAGESFTKADNNMSSANSIKLSVTYKGQIARNDDKDFYRFVMSKKETVTISAQAWVEMIFYSIYDASGNEVWGTSAYWNGTSGKSSISEKINLSKGTYYFVTEKYSENTGKYSFSLTTPSTNIGVTGVNKPVLLSAANVNGGVKVTWKKVSGAAKYRVFRRTYNTSEKKWSSWAKVADTTAINYTDKTVKSGTKYNYTVRCISSDCKTYTSTYDAAGKSITYVAAPVISSITNVNGGVKIVWPKTAGAAKYRVFRKTGSGKWSKLADTTALNYTDKKAANGTTYVYTVRCLNSTGGYAGAHNAGKKITYILRPTISSVTSPKTKQILVKWSKNAKSTGYQIQYSASSKFASGNKTVTVKSAETVSRTISSLTAKKKYYVRIRTYKTVSGKNYYSAWSAVKNVTTK